MSEWKVSHTYAGKLDFWQVYRLRDPNGIDHSGNRETFGIYDTEKEAEKYAKTLNEGKYVVLRGKVALIASILPEIYGRKGEDNEID